MARCGVVVLGLAGLIGLTSCSSSEEGSGAPSAGDCEQITELVLDGMVVRTPAEQAERKAEQEGLDEQAEVERLRKSVDLLPEEHRGAAAAMFDLAVAHIADPSWAPGEQDREVIDAGSEALEDAVPWAEASCGGGLLWACSARQTFTPVGASIEAEGGDTPGGDAEGFATAEEAVGEREGKREEQVRTEDEVTFLWKDADGDVTAQLTVNRDGERWNRGAESSCRSEDTPEDTFEPVGESIPPGD